MKTQPPEDLHGQTQFAILRHALTAWNEAKRIQGLADLPLSPAGETQARQWARQLAHQPWGGILTSNLVRARQTARLMNQLLGLEVTVDEGLREQDWGVWSGQTLKQIKDGQKAELRRQVAAGWDFRPPGGESRQQVLTRCRAAFQRAARKWSGQTLLVVAHESVIKCLLNHMAGRRFVPGEPPLLRSWHLHRFAHNGRRLILQRVNALALWTGDPR
jgi:broad specificity phosphatase PhoE